MTEEALVKCRKADFEFIGKKNFCSDEVPCNKDLQISANENLFLRKSYCVKDKSKLKFSRQFGSPGTFDEFMITVDPCTTGGCKSPK